jgi:hypothetical protein
MANHKFHGDWTYVDLDDPPTFPKTKVKLVIPEENGVLRSGSNHEGAALGGNASMDAKHISMREGEVEYEGDLLVNGPTLVILGAWKNKSRRQADGSFRQAKGRDGQEDGTWIITKP